MWLLHNMYQLLFALNIVLQSASTSSPLDEHIAGKTTTPKLGKRCSILPAPDVHSFRELIADQCYVDKTQYLSKFLVRENRISAKTFFLARPRRSGKSVLVDTMFEYFQGNQPLFKDTFIGQKYPQPWTKYPVIRLDFSRALSARNVDKFEDDLKYKLETIAVPYGFNLKAPSPESAIDELIRKVKDAEKSPVVVLIDEYDAPYTRAYVNDRKEAKKILDVLQSFFSTLKGDPNIHFCFITGVTRIAMTNFFSGPNALTDLTMDVNYPAIVGFTEEELWDYFGESINNVATIWEKEARAILKVMEERHNGFQFSCADVRVYSPCSVIAYLSSVGTRMTGWSETGGSGTFLNEKLKEYKDIAVQYLFENQGKDVSASPITATVRSLQGKIDYIMDDERSFTALLFHSGYLSIRRCQGELCSLHFSNTELLADYTERISYVIHKDDKAHGWVAGVKSMKTDLIAGRWEDFITKLGSYYAHIPYFLTMYQKTCREAWFQLILNMALYYAGLELEPVMEDASNKGRADVIVTNFKTTFIFEIKYYDNAENALDQCYNNYVLKHIFLLQRTVVCLALQFSEKGDIMRWGVATYSEKGELLNEYGPEEKDERYRLGEKCELVKPPAELSPEECEEISSYVESYKNENPSCTIQAEEVIKFLEQMTTTKNRVDLAKKITSDTVSLYAILPNIKPMLSSKFKSRITFFLKKINSP